MSIEELINNRTSQLKREVGSTLSKVECEQFVASCVYGALEVHKNLNTSFVGSSHISIKDIIDEDTKDIEKIKLNATSIYKRTIAEITRQEEELFTTALRTTAEPPIKGEITRGKIIWRGIRVVRKRVGSDFYSWLEQKGKRISPKFHVDAKPVYY